MHSGNISVIVSLLLRLRPSRNALPPSDLWTPLKRLLKPHFNSSLSWYQVCKLYLLIRVYFQCYVECSALLEFDTSNLMFTLSLTSNVFFYPPPDDSDESRFVPQTRGKGETQMQTPINEQVQLYYIYIIFMKHKLRRWGRKRSKQIQKGPLWHQSFSCAQNTFVDPIHALQRMNPFHLEYPHYFFFSAAHLTNFTVK